MKQIARWMLMGVALWTLSCGWMRAEDLKVTINGQAVPGSYATLEEAVSASNVALAEIKSLSVTNGRWLDADWEWLHTNRDEFTQLASLTTAAGVSVAATPDKDDPIFPKSIEWVAMEKLEELGRNAFIGCQKLKGVSLKEVTDVGKYAFQNCTALKHIDLPEVESIGNNAFSGCTSLLTINCAALKKVNYTFLECTSLNYACFPSMEGVPFESFAGCSQLSSLFLPKATTFIWNFKPYLEGCSSIKYLFVGKIEESGLTYKKFHEKLPAERWIIPCDATTGEPLTGAALAAEYDKLKGLDDSYEVADGNKIGGPGDDVLCGWKLGKEVYKITVKVVNPEKGTAFAKLLYAGKDDVVEVVAEPGEGFKLGNVQCTPSTAVNGNEVTMPGEDLTITVEFVPLTVQQEYIINSNPYNGVDLKGAVATSGLALDKINAIEAKGHITVADWEWLRDNASNLSSLTEFVAASADDIPNGTMSIAPHLKKISISERVKSIGDCAFLKAVNLEAVEIPGVEIICGKSFQGCTKLTKLNFPKLKSVGEHAFEKSSLQELTAPVLKTVGEGAFSGSELEKCEFSKLGTVGNEAFMNCKKLNGVILPVLSGINDHLFTGCTSLKWVKCQEVKKIGAYAFSGCTALDSAMFPKVTYITPGAFGATPDNIYESCGFLSKLFLGANPPMYGDTENQDRFAGKQASNQLVLVGADGTPLAGSEYTDAVARYREDVGWDGNAKQWRGWSLEKQYLLEFEVEKVDGKANGTLICSNNIVTGTMVAEGTELEFTAKPDADFQVDTWKINGTETSATEGPNFPNILKVTMDGDKTVTVLFKAKPTAPKFAITKQFTPADGTMGVVSGPKEAVEGVKVVFEVKQTAGHKVKTIAVKTNGTPAVDIAYSKEAVENQYSFTMPAESVTIAAEFEAISTPQEYEVVLKFTPSDGTLGRLEATKVRAIAGEIVGLKVVEGENAQLKRGSLHAYMNDASKTNVALTVQTATANSYTFTMPAAGVVIEATFESVQESAVESAQLALLSVSPNPCGDWLYVAGCELAQRIELFTVAGEPVITYTLNGERAVRIPTAGLPAGIYLLRATAADGQRTVRVLHE